MGVISFNDSQTAGTAAVKLVQQAMIGLLSALLLFLAACGQGVDPQPGGAGLEPGNNFSAPLPGRLQKQFNGTLTAQIVVDGGAPVGLTVDLAGNTVTGQINDLSPGNHTFVINYFLSGVIVATASTTGTITAGGTTPIAFASNSIIYPDTDGDGFTNLAEIESNTLPNDPNSRPPGEGPRHSTNYVMADIMGISPVVGDATSTAYKTTSVTSSLGRSTSANYVLGP